MAGAVVGGLIGAAGQMGAASIQADAQRAAAAAQERAARENIAFQKDIYNQNTARMDPWVQYGTTQMNALSNLMPSLTERYDMAKYQAGPEYANTMATTDRAQKMLEAKSSASGMYGGGTMANQLQSNAAYLANQGYQQGLQNYTGQNKSIYDMLNTGSNVGLNAAGQQNVAGTNLGNNVGDILSSVGNTQASALANSGKAWGGAIENIGKLGGGISKSADESGYFSGAGDWLKNLFGSNQQQSSGMSGAIDVNQLYNGYGPTNTSSYMGNNLAQGNWSGNMAYNNLLGSNSYGTL